MRPEDLGPISLEVKQENPFVKARKGCALKGSMSYLTPPPPSSSNILDSSSLRVEKPAGGGSEKTEA